MFCKFCGKSIDGDSLYCMYCGKRINSVSNILTSENKDGLFTKFRRLSHKKQIAVIVYVIWLLIWIAILIGNLQDNNFYENVLTPFFISTILLPFVCWSFVYLIRLNENNKKEKHGDNTLSSSNIIAETKTVEETKSPENTEQTKMFNPQSVPLQFFALKMGKMQHHKTTEGTGHYCTFTSKDGKVTRVEMSESTKHFTPHDILEKKEELYVESLSDGTYLLTL